MLGAMTFKSLITKWIHGEERAEQLCASAHPLATKDVQELWLDKKRAKAQRSIPVTCPAEYFPLEGRFQSLLG